MAKLSHAKHMVNSNREKNKIENDPNKIGILRSKRDLYA